MNGTPLLTLMDEVIDQRVDTEQVSCETRTGGAPQVAENIRETIFFLEKGSKNY